MIKMNLSDSTIEWRCSEEETDPLPVDKWERCFDHLTSQSTLNRSEFSSSQNISCSNNNGSTVTCLGDPLTPGHSNGSNVDVKVISLTFYVITFVFGIVGNSLVIFIIAKYDKIRVRSVSNYYIWNLAFADELFILTLPFYCFTSFTNNWIFGDWTCKIATVFRECNRYASLLTLMTLSVDRFLATLPTMAHLRQVRVGVGLCVAIWAVCFLLSIPYWLFSRAVTVESTHRVSCKLDWPLRGYLFYHQVWLYIQLALGIVVPFAVIAVFNVLLLRRVRAGGTRPKQLQQQQYHHPGDPGKRTCQQVAQVSRREKMNAGMTKVILVILVVFAVCHLPYHTCQILWLHMASHFSYHRSLPNPKTVQLLTYLNLVTQILLFFSSCANPIIYGIFNRNYRKLYSHAVCCGRWEDVSSATSLWTEQQKERRKTDAPGAIQITSNISKDTNCRANDAI